MNWAYEARTSRVVRHRPSNRLGLRGRHSDKRSSRQFDPKRILILIFFVLAFCPTSSKADQGGYWGTVLEMGAANYVVQMDGGNLLDVEWDSGYDDWSRGDRVTLTTESGGGYMYSESGQTEVDVFPYNPADIGD